MQAEENPIKIVALWITLGALFLIPLTPLIVANNMFFPFITGKAFFFRILVEVAFAGWVVLAFMDKKYRPRWTWVSVALVALVSWLFIANLFAVNPGKAFWSNFERMEGWITFIHLLGLFIVMSAVLRVKELWRTWWYVSIGVATLLSLYGVAQMSCTAHVFTKAGAICQNWGAIHQGGMRLDASLGNATYLAVYMLFHVFIAGWLAFTTKRRWLRYALLSFAVFFAWTLFATATRGTILGFVGGLFLAATLTAVTMGKRARGFAVGSLAVILIIVGGFWIAKDAGVIKHDPVLGRIASISLAQGQTRFTIWRMAFDGFKQSPKTVIVGWGQEGFNYVFNQYYEPSLYAQEQWFDRAHNAFIDMLVQGGLPAFLLYIGLFIAALWTVWRGRTPISRAEQIVLTALLFGYAFHNLFVFDNITSYILFIGVLALIDSTAGKPIPAFERAPEFKSINASTITATTVAVLLAVVIVTVDAPGMAAASGIINAMSPQQDGIKGNIAAWKWEIDHSAFASQEVRERLLVFAEQIVRNPSISNAEKQKLATFAITQMQKEVRRAPLDARLRFELSTGYASFGDTGDALTQMDIARKLSPKKETLILEQGFIKLQVGDIKGANESFQEVYRIAPQFNDLAAYAAAGKVLVGEFPQAQALLKQSFGTTTVDMPILISVYAKTGRYGQIIDILRARLAKSPEATTTIMQLAVTYDKDKQPARAVSLVRSFIATHPASKVEGQRLIKAIQQNKIP